MLCCTSAYSEICGSLFQKENKTAEFNRKHKKITHGEQENNQLFV